MLSSPVLEALEVLSYPVTHSAGWPSTVTNEDRTGVVVVAEDRMALKIIEFLIEYRTIYGA